MVYGDGFLQDRAAGLASRSGCEAGRRQSIFSMTETGNSNRRATNVGRFDWARSWTLLAGRGYGLVNAANGIGKILGLCCLALVVGFSKVLSDQASVAGILPTFLFLAACGLVIGVCLDTA